jgi:hypothetical protein
LLLVFFIAASSIGLSSYKTHRSVLRIAEMQQLSAASAHANLSSEIKVSHHQNASHLPHQHLSQLTTAIFTELDTNPVLLVLQLRLFLPSVSIRFNQIYLIPIKKPPKWVH